MIRILLLLASVVLASDCLDSLPVNKVNDNYCDCLDDEPLTSACSPSDKYFQCKSEDMQIPASRVDDMVCDCCDGSDETGVQCVNTCNEKHEKLQAKLQAEREIRLQGELGFRDLVAKACQLDTAGAMEAGKEEDEELAAQKREQLQNELAEVRESVAKMTEELEAERISMLHLDKLTKQELEQVVVRLAVETERGGKALQKIMRNLAGDDEPEWVKDPGSLVEAKNRMEALEEEEQEDEEQQPTEQRAEEDFGPSNVWKTLYGERFQVNLDKYKYEITLFKDFTQDHVSLGRWAGWGIDSKDKYSTMRFEQGQHCHIGIDRSITVKVVCGKENRLVDVVEPNTCMYEATFESPAACVPAAFEEDQCR